MAPRKDAITKNRIEMNGVFTMASLTFGRPLIPGRESAAVSISSLENRKAAGKRSPREWMVGHLFMVHNLSGRDEQRAYAPKFFRRPEPLRLIIHRCRHQIRAALKKPVAEFVRTLVRCGTITASRIRTNPATRTKTALGRDKRFHRQELPNVTEYRETALRIRMGGIFALRCPSELQ